MNNKMKISDVKKNLVKLIEIPGILYHMIKRNKLVNKTPTIIASDCVAGYIYHDMGLRFNSPTINLYFSFEDFIKLVSNLSEFMNSEVIELKNREEKYPVGIIKNGNEEVIIHFMHYDDFATARKKWNERKARIDYSNIYIIQIIGNANRDKLEQFERLPYKNKLCITNKNIINSENIVVHKVLNKVNYCPGQIFNYKYRFCPKRYLDDIDYISFLNEKD